MALLVLSQGAAADPTVVSTTYLGPFTGDGAALHPDNIKPNPIAYYGTDLGWSYAHGGKMHFLFGDTWATESYAPIETSTGFRFDDGFGSIDLVKGPDPAGITRGNLPPIRLGQNPGTTEMSAIDPGHAMDLGKTPMGGFSNGNNEFGIFNITKPRACATDADCNNGMSCDGTLGYVGARWFQEEYLTLACSDGSPGCNADPLYEAGAPVQGSGMCIDTTSTMHGGSISNLLGPVALRVLIGMRDPDRPKKYIHTRTWLTNKFMNVAARTVQDFNPDRAMYPAQQDFRPAQAAGPGRRVFLWGRPGFIGVAANGRSLGLYFAFADLPAGPEYQWQPRYFAGTTDGVPHFSSEERDAVPLDLDSSRGGVQAAEVHDIVNQMSVAWVESLRKWVMFYGGGLIKLPTAALPECGVLQLFAGTECKDVNMGNGAVRMRTADHPFGPWSPPVDVIAGGDPAGGATGQFGPGGALRHPDCSDPACAPHSDMFAYQSGEHGFFYGANIIAEWIRPAPGGVDILWNASTWDPYRVVLLRTSMDK